MLRLHKCKTCGEMKAKRGRARCAACQVIYREELEAAWEAERIAESKAWSEELDALEAGEKPRAVELTSEICVVDCNPEFADITNPRGEITGHIYQAQTCINGGEIYTHFKRFTEAEKPQALAFVDKVNDALEAGEKLNMAHWHYHRDAYGSDAYIANGGELELMQWEREQEQR